MGYIDDIAAPECPLHSGKEKLLGSLSEFEQILKTEEVDEVFVALPVKSYYEIIAKIITLGEQLGVTLRMPAECLSYTWQKPLSTTWMMPPS